MKLCYFGINKPIPCPRDQVYLDGLRGLGVEVVECVDSAPSFRKFFNVIKKYWSITKDFDFIWVGYLSAILVPFAKILSRKIVIFNALNSMYESNVLDQKRFSTYSQKAILIWLADYLAFQMADMVLVETEQQKEFISNFFWIKKSKLFVVMTGVDEFTFFPDPTIAKQENFTVLFRGWFVNGTGVETVIESAKIMKARDPSINYILIGRGQLQNVVRREVEDNQLDNVKIVMEYLPGSSLRKLMLSSHVMLGPFSSHDRMDRTIQNKTIEALALGMPYIVRDSKSNRELLSDRKDCLFVKADDAQDVVDKIIELKKDVELRGLLSCNARALFERKLTSQILGKQVFDLLVSIH